MSYVVVWVKCVQNEKYKKVYTGLIGVYMEGDMAA